MRKEQAIKVGTIQCLIKLRYKNYYGTENLQYWSPDSFSLTVYDMFQCLDTVRSTQKLEGLPDHSNDPVDEQVKFIYVMPVVS